MLEMMKNSGMWNEKTRQQTGRCDACPQTTSSMPKPRSESSAASLELYAIV